MTHYVLDPETAELLAQGVASDPSGTYVSRYTRQVRLQMRNGGGRVGSGATGGGTLGGAPSAAPGTLRIPDATAARIAQVVGGLRGAGLDAASIAAIIRTLPDVVDLMGFGGFGGNLGAKGAGLNMDLDKLGDGGFARDPIGLVAEPTPGALEGRPYIPYEREDPRRNERYHSNEPDRSHSNDPGGAIHDVPGVDPRVGAQQELEDSIREWLGLPEGSHFEPGAGGDRSQDRWVLPDGSRYNPNDGSVEPPPAPAPSPPPASAPNPNQNPRTTSEFDPDAAGPAGQGASAWLPAYLLRTLGGAGSAWAVGPGANYGPDAPGQTVVSLRLAAPLADEPDRLPTASQVLATSRAILAGVGPGRYPWRR